MCTWIRGNNFGSRSNCFFKILNNLY